MLVFLVISSRVRDKCASHDIFFGLIVDAILWELEFARIFIFVSAPYCFWLDTHTLLFALDNPRSALPTFSL
jgi:hypothetical protein